MALSAFITIFFLLNATYVTQWHFIKQLENATYDMRLRMTMPGGQDERIVIIDIDEKSLAEEGRWPWPRTRVAELVDLLFDKYNIALLGMDVVWAEPDVSSGLLTLEQLASEQLSDNDEYLNVLASLRPSLLNDEIFAQSLKNRPVVLGYYFDTETRIGTANITGVLPKPTFTSGNFNGRELKIFEASGYGANLPIIQDAAIDAGHFNPDPDIDGIVRKVPMLILHENNYYSSLSLAISRQLMGGIPVQPVFAEGTQDSENYSGMEWLQLGDYQIPVDEFARSLIPYRGPKGSFRYVSATDIFNNKVTQEQLAGKIALLGTSAPGLLDLRSAPMQTNYPGVEIHANLVAGFIDQNIKHSPAWIMGAEIVMVLFIGLAMGILLPVMSPLIATLFTIVVLALTTSFNIYVWQSGDIVLPLASILLLILLLYVANMSYGYFIESRGKRQLAGLFGQYIPPEIVNEMSSAPAHFSLQGESRNMTVFFSDVRDFTSISESLEPSDLQNLMNELLTPVTRIIHQHRGTIDKYMGDAVMAFWGAPLSDPDHARHAVHAALDIVLMLQQLKKDFQAKGWPPLRLGVGIHTGIMHVGDMGSEFRKAYTVMGDAVNLGSRLEGITKQYGVQIIVSESTKQVVEDVIYRELDEVRVKGKDKPVKIYEPLGKKGEVSGDTLSELKLYEQARKYYRQQQWDLAELQFINLQKQSPMTKLYSVYLDRIQHFRANPPDDNWDGVFTYKTK
jgi:adenylate cyclase